MNARLMAYECVPPGFETVIGNADVEMGKTWNLWWNVKLTDDPQAWDTEIKLINRMQGELGELSIDQRLIRAQMAEFCRLHPLFPQSIEILCREIGEDRFSKPVKIGCEGRGLLDSLGYHGHGSLNAQRKEILTRYLRSLRKWLQQSRTQTPTDSKVFGFLGKPTSRKVALARKIVQVVDPSEASAAPLRKLARDSCASFDLDFKTLDRPFNCFTCLPSQTSIPGCQCCPSMLLDSCLLCAGAFGENRSMPDEFRRFIEESALAYSVAINSWLSESSTQHAAWPRNMRYVPGDRLSEIAEKIDSSLGRRSEVKEWLATCLLKTIKDNQRWHKRAELIDDFSSATSYFARCFRKGKFRAI